MKKWLVIFSVAVIADTEETAIGDASLAVERVMEYPGTSDGNYVQCEVIQVVDNPKIHSITIAADGGIDIG